MRQKAFEKDGYFYKGNLHTHTEISDGQKPVQEVIDIYKEMNYDFLALTDHNTVFKTREYNNGIYIIPALEIHSSIPDGSKTHHMVALTTYDNDKATHGEYIKNVEWTNSRESAENIFNMMTEKDYFLIYCHSMWSRTEPSEYENLNLSAHEVYNGICEYKYGQGNQEVYWDMMLRKGKKIWGVAADDCHGGENHNGRGFVMVKSENLNAGSIIESLSDGSFYSSRGPEIHDFYIEDGMVHIKCSPVQTVDFVSYEYRGARFTDEGIITEKSFKFTPEIDYIRAEVTDKNGLTAWTNPIFLKT